jgi:hypothetical protein
VMVENLRQYRRSPLLEESVLHLVYESAPSNNGMHPTANSIALIRKAWKLDTLCARRVMPGVGLLIY